MVSFCASSGEEGDISQHVLVTNSGRQLLFPALCPLVALREVTVEEEEAP